MVPLNTSAYTVLTIRPINGTEDESTTYVSFIDYVLL